MVRRVDLCLSLFLVILSGFSAAYAQDESPRNEFNVGYTYLTDLNFGSHGFNVGFAESATSWFQVEAQFDAHFNLGKTTFDQYTTIAGPKFALRTGRLTPYVHFLLGASHFRAFNRTGTEFAIKYGGGVDINLTPTLSARIGLNDLVIWNPVSHRMVLDTGLVVRF
jgi:opacity protein-like surface antigen